MPTKKDDHEPVVHHDPPTPVHAPAKVTGHAKRLTELANHLRGQHTEHERMDVAAELDTMAKEMSGA